MKIIVNPANRYVGSMDMDFELAAGFYVVEVDDVVGATLNDLCRYENGQWVRDNPPPPPVTTEPVYAQPGKVVST